MKDDARRLRFIEHCAGRERRHLAANPLSALAYVLRLSWRAARRGKTFVLHLHNPVLASVAVMAKAVNPAIRVVATQRNDWRFFRPHQKLGLRVLARLSDRYVLCGRALARTMPASVRKRLEDAGRISTIPNGINPRQLQRYARTPAAAMAGDVPVRERPRTTAVVVARMVPQKNCRFVLELLSKTRSIDRLTWFGDGVERPELEKEIERLGLGGRIELRGRRPRSEVLAALSQGTLYIASSKWEGLSVADLEAVALGCWPIMSDIPQREEIAEALDIPLYPLSDMGAWIRGIESFLARPAAEQEEMRARIAARTRETFDLNVTVARYVALYRDLALQDIRAT